MFVLNEHFNFPLALPASLVTFYSANSYNQPTTLPSGLEKISVGSAFAHDLVFPSSLREIFWSCNRPITIPEGVCKVMFDSDFQQPVVLPATLKRVSFLAEIYPHRLSLPRDLEEFTWSSKDFNGFELPEQLQKLTWGSELAIRLPLGLRKLVIKRSAPLILPEGLAEVTFKFLSKGCHYELPESVREVTAFGSYSTSFTHPSTLQHLRVEFSAAEKDLSNHKICKVTIEDSSVRIAQWPQGLEELAFTVDDMEFPLRVPIGCRVVGEKRPQNVIME